MDTLREEVGPSRPAARAFTLNHRVLLAQAAEGESVDTASKLDFMLWDNLTGQVRVTTVPSSAEIDAAESCLGDGTVALTISGQTNLLYAIEASTNLVQWT